MTRSPLPPQDKNANAMRYLEQLTPLGSEFVGDPVACYDHIRATNRRRHDMLVKHIAENKDLRERNTALVAACEAALAKIERAIRAEMEQSLHGASEREVQASIEADQECQQLRAALGRKP